MNTNEELTYLILDKLEIKDTEIFLPKYRNSRPANISWKSFILAVLTLAPNELYYFCGYKTKDTFAICLKSRYKDLIRLKGRNTWRTYLLSLIQYKYCSSCSLIKKLTEFSLDKSRPDYLDSNCKDCCKGYHKDNLDKFAGYSAKRKASILSAMPKWANDIKIRKIYKNRPLGYHVDHIIPLQNNLVCGLHVENNLQYLSIEENLIKGNSYQIT